MNRVIVEKVLGAEIKVSCNDEKIHTIGYANLLNAENSTINIKKGTINNDVLKCVIDIHLECDGYDVVVDGKKINILSYGGNDERYFR